jgi:hypothetical protein
MVMDAIDRRNHHFQANPIRQAIIQIDRIGLTERAQLLMMAENELSIIHVDGRNHAIRPGQERTPGVVIEQIDGQESGWRYLLCRANNDKAEPQEACTSEVVKRVKTVVRTGARSNPAKRYVRRSMIAPKIECVSRGYAKGRFLQHRTDAP